jgi:hypothetical protein
MADNKKNESDPEPLKETKVSQIFKNDTKEESKLFLFFLFLFFSLIVLFELYKPQIYQELKALKLLPEKEVFTELYFEDYNHLPRESITGKTASFAFTINNLEGKDFKYTYEVFMKNEYGIILIDTKTISIKNNDSQTINESYTFDRDFAQETLFVRLREKNQEIHFLLTNNNNLQ